MVKQVGFTQKLFGKLQMLVMGIGSMFVAVRVRKSDILTIEVII